MWLKDGCSHRITYTHRRTWSKKVNEYVLVYVNREWVYRFRAGHDRLFWKITVFFIFGFRLLLFIIFFVFYLNIVRFRDVLTDIFLASFFFSNIFTITSKLLSIFTYFDSTTTDKPCEGHFKWKTRNWLGFEILCDGEVWTCVFDF